MDDHLNVRHSRVYNVQLFFVSPIATQPNSLKNVPQSYAERDASRYLKIKP